MPMSVRANRIGSWIVAPRHAIVRSPSCARAASSSGGMSSPPSPSWHCSRRGSASLSDRSSSRWSLLTPVLAWLILTLGWRWTFLAVGVAAVVVVMPLGFWVIRDSPEAMGLSPDGGPGRPGGAPAVAGELHGDERRRADPYVLADRSQPVLLRVLDESALGARRPHAHRPRLQRHDRLVGPGARRRLEHGVRR